MVKQKFMKNIAKVAGIAFLLFGISQVANAADAGTIATNVKGSINNIALAAQAFFGLCGLICIGTSIFTFIKYNKTEGQGAKLSTGFFLLIGGCMLFYMASLIQTTGDTAWGTGGGDRSNVTITN
jgi:hypothetical protein